MDAKRCRVCEQDFARPALSRQHYQSRHAGQVVTYYVCPVCRWHFLNHYHAALHEELTHLSIRPIEWVKRDSYTPEGTPPLAHCTQCQYRHQDARWAAHPSHADKIKEVEPSAFGTEPLAVTSWPPQEPAPERTQLSTPSSQSTQSDSTFPARDIRIRQGLVSPPASGRVPEQEDLLGDAEAAATSVLDAPLPPSLQEVEVLQPEATWLAPLLGEAVGAPAPPTLQEVTAYIRGSGYPMVPDLPVGEYRVFPDSAARMPFWLRVRSLPAGRGRGTSGQD